MSRIAVLALLASGCNIDVIDCIDLGGQGCAPPALSLTRPGLADAEPSAGVAIAGLYRLTVRGGQGALHVGGAAHVAIAAIDGNEVTLRGEDAGQDKLEIRQGESAAVDWVRVIPLARVALVPRELAFVKLDAPPPYALLAGSASELVIRLTSSDGGRLIDQGLSLEVAGAAATATRWDAFRVAADGPFVVDVLTADRAFAFTVPVVTAIQDIVPVAGGDVADLEAVPEGPLALVCFAGVTAGLHVAGLRWEIEGPGVSVPVHGSLVSGGCVYLDDPVEGVALRVRAGGLERAFIVRIAPRTL